MKPYHFLFTTLAGTSAIGAVGTIVGPSIADSRPQYSAPLSAPPSAEHLLAALPTTDRLWVKVRSAISIEELAEKLAQDESKLAKLNDVDEDHSFGRGDWLFPAKAASRLSSLQRSTPVSCAAPLLSPLPPSPRSQQG